LAVVWRLGLILFGFAVATLAAAIFHVPTADAAEPQRTAQTQSRYPDTTEGAGRDPDTAYETAPVLRRSRTDAFGDDTGGAGNDDAAEADDDDVSGEGEPLPPNEASDGNVGITVDDTGTAADGAIDLAEPEPPRDGEDPTRDTRPPEDADVFANPPAGFDPLLFQIEDVDPIRTDRRPERLARFEPYDPIGIRIGTFVFFPEAEIGGLWTDNVLSSPDARSDIAAEIRSTSRLVSNWSRHAVELKGTTFTTFHDDFPSEDDRAWGVEARGRIDISRRTNFQGLVGHDRSQESRSAVDADQVGERPDVTVDQAHLTFNHRFNRLSVQLRGSVSDTDYSPANGESNADRDTLETTETVRAAWTFKPTLSVFAEHELNQRDKEVPTADGILRDSKGNRTRVGLDFGSDGAVIRGEISVGYGRQSPDDPRLAAVDAVLFDANLAWRPTEITSFLLTAQSDIDDTTTAGTGGVVARSIGLEARHALRRYLIASAGITYTDYDYDKAPIEERAVTTFVGADYYASPELVLFTRYQHLDYASSQPDSDYDSDEIRVGVKVRK